MRHLTLAELLELHHRLIATSGGSHGMRDMGALESAAAQPRMTFAQQELYETLSDKAAALGHSLIQNHPFIDGNKRVGHAAMELLLVLNGYELSASVEEAESFILAVASGTVSRQEMARWVEQHSSTPGS